MSTQTRSGPEWEVEAGCPGTDIAHYFQTADEVMDYCGRLLYSNSLFEMLLLRIRQCERYGTENFTEGFVEELKGDTRWVMWTKDERGDVRERQLSTKHELFCMMYAELRTGATHVEARSISNVCEKEPNGST